MVIDVKSRLHIFSIISFYLMCPAPLLADSIETYEVDYNSCDSNQYNSQTFTDPMPACMLLIQQMNCSGHNYDFQDLRPAYSSGQDKYGYNCRAQKVDPRAYFKEQNLIFVAPSCAAGYSNIYGKCAKNTGRNIDPPPNTCSAHIVYKVGDPVSVVNGNIFEEATDFSTFGQQPMIIKRYYQSNSLADGLLGYGHWKFEFEYRFDLSAKVIITPRGELFRLAPAQSSQDLTNFYNEGPIYVKFNAGQYSYLNDNYVASMPDGTIVTFAHGRDYTGWKVSNISKPDGNNLSFQYTNDCCSFDMISTITDARGRIFKFVPLSGYPRVVSSITYSENADAVSPAFKVDFNYQNQTYAGINYNYTLVNVTRSSNDVNNSSNNWNKIDSIGYSYDDKDHRDIMTSVTSPSGIKSSTWQLDRGGRAILSSMAGKYNTTQFSYPSDSMTTVISPLGKQFNYNYSSYNEKLQLDSINATSTQSTPASTFGIQYDGDGNITKQTDEEGRITNIIRDIYGRPTSIMQGVAN